MSNKIDDYANNRLARELQNENPPRKFKNSNGQIVTLTDKQYSQERARRIERNKETKKNVEAERRQRHTAEWMNDRNADLTMGGGQGSYCPDVQYNDAPMPLCARLSERTKNRMAMFVIFLPILVIAFFALLGDTK